MTFSEKYHHESTWHGRALVMEIFHLAACQNDKKWTIERTAKYFCVSIGLVSENLKLAKAIHYNPSVMLYTSRQDALRRLNG